MSPLIFNHYNGFIMVRTLFIIIALALAFVIIKRLISTKSRSKTASQPGTLDYKNTVRCEHCGTHVPVATAYKTDDKYYCNESHYLEHKNKT